MTNFLYDDSKKEKKWFYFRWLIIFFAILAILFFAPKTYEWLPGDSSDNVETASAADDDVSDLKEMREISDDVSKKPKKFDITKDSNAGVQWSALGADSSFFASFTKATERVTYDDLKKRGKNTGIAGSYGFVLDQSGLDHSFVEGDSGAIFSTLGRLFFGAIIMLGYFLQAAVNYMFSFIATIGEYINVFKWFTNATIDESSPFAGVQKVVHSIVKPLQSLGIVVMTFLFVGTSALAILGWRVSQRNPRTGVGSGLLASAGKLLMRFFVILIAPLLLATIFSSLMTATKDAYSGTSASDYAVYSNLVDFDKWVKYSRLALPEGHIDGMNYTLNAGKVGHATHEDILNINADAAGLKNARDTRTAYKLDKIGTVIGIEDKDINEVKGEVVNDWAMSIVSKWTRLETVTSASYESYVRNQYMAKLTAGNEDGKNVKVDDDDYAKAIVQDGNLKAVNGQFTTGSPKAPTQDEYNYAQVGETDKVALSSLGMYNYLSTTFDSSSMTFTRTDLMVGKAFTPYHASVGLAGRGIVAFGNYSIMVATIYSIAVLGIIFAMLAINAIIVSVPKALGALGGSIFGSMTNFIKMIMVIFVLAIELVGGAILYIVSQKIIIGVSMLGDGIMGKGSEVLTKAPDSVALASGLSNTGYGAINIVIAILLFAVAYMLIVHRGKILGGFATTFESAMNNLFAMFEPTQAGSQGFQNGKNGLYTTNDKGDNQFSRPDGTSTEFSRRKNEGANGGASAFNKGAQSRSSGVADPKSLLGKAVNTKAGITDALRAKEAELGRPLTPAEKNKEVAKQGTLKTGAGVVRTVGSVLGSNKVAGIGDDMESSRQAKINNNLANAEKKEQEVQELAKGASQGDQGETQEIKDINAYADAQMGQASDVNHNDVINNGTNQATTMQDSSNEVDTSAVNTAEVQQQNEQNEQLAQVVSEKPVSTGNENVDSSAIQAVSSAESYVEATNELNSATNELAQAKESGDEQAVESATAKQNIVQAKVQEKQIASAVAGEQYVNKAKAHAKSAQSVEQAAKSKLQNALNNPDTATQEQISQMKQDVKQAEQRTAVANNGVEHAKKLQNAVNGKVSQNSLATPTGSSMNANTSGVAMSKASSSAQVSQSRQTKASGMVSKTAPSTSKASSSPIPTFNSTQAVNKAVTQAKANYQQAQQLASSAPPQQRQQLEAKVQQAQHELKNAQAGASKFFGNQPAVGMIDKKMLNGKNGELPTNKQVRGHLVAIRDAHTDFRRVAQMPKPTPELVKEAKTRLETAKKQAVDLGMRKDTVNNISAIKSGLDQLNQSQTEFISGTGDEFIAESVKTTFNVNKQNNLKNKVTDFKHNNFKL